MIFAIVMFALIFLGIAYYVAHPVLSELSERRAAKKTLPSKKDVFSEPGRRIVEKSKSLPIELQGDDVAGMVKALDIKYGIEAVNNHFRISDYAPAGAIAYDVHGKEFPGLFKTYVFSWQGTNTCKHLKMCKFPEYRKMAVAIEQVEIAKKEQDRALEVAGVQHDLDAIESWTNRLREEREIMNEITKELS